jgi:ribosomal RNA-processing protein 17
MTVDHGLGGRESKKSREKRAKRLEKKMKNVKIGDGKKKKKEVIFDENSRVEFLTGFRKRKQERRQYGLAMQYLKDKKASKDLKLKAPPVESEKVSKDDDEIVFTGNEKAQSTSFSDQHTASMFGGIVSVEIGTNIADQMSEALEPRKKHFREPTKLERALKKVKQKMNSKGSSKRGKGSRGASGKVDSLLRQGGGSSGKKTKRSR